jgi:AraC-like DNA-binding protein
VLLICYTESILVSVKIMAVKPVSTAIVTPEAFLSLVGGEVEITPVLFGFTSMPETKVMPRRTLDEHLFYFVTRNAFEIELEKKVLRISRGAFCWIMPGVTHRVRLPNKSKPFTNYYLRVRLIDPRSRKPIRLADDWMLRPEAWPALSYFKQAVDALETPYGKHNIARVRGWIVLMAAWILDQNSTQAAGGKIFSPVQYRRLIRYMDMNIGNEISPGMLAELMELSPPYFSRVFHRSFGMAPRQWIVQRRIQRAATLLVETELKAKEIAYQLGYSNRYFFSEQFKQVMGVGPKAYRKGVAG